MQEIRTGHICGGFQEAISEIQRLKTALAEKEGVTANLQTDYAYACSLLNVARKELSEVKAGQNRGKRIADLEALVREALSERGNFTANGVEYMLIGHSWIKRAESLLHSSEDKP